VLIVIIIDVAEFVDATMLNEYLPTPPELSHYSCSR